CSRLDTVPDDAFVSLLRTSVLSPDARMTTALPTPVRPLHDIPVELQDHPRYRVAEHLGSGGIGMVLKAEHRLMERLVALKIINPALTNKPSAVERFHREVRAAARLNHSNIVTAFDADQAGATHFLVMEFVEGQSLDRLLDGSSFIL